MASRSGYAADSFKLSVETVAMNMLANIFMRAPGESVGTFALESAIDELAIELEIDRLNCASATNPTRIRPRVYPSRHGISSKPGVRAPSGSVGTGAASCRANDARASGWLAWAAPPRPILSPHAGAAAQITLARDGTALVEVAAHEMGMGTATTTAIVAADRLGLPLDRVEVRYGDSIIPGAISPGDPSRPPRLAVQ